MNRRERQRRIRRRNEQHPVKRALMIGSLVTVCGIVLGLAGVTSYVLAIASSAPNVDQRQPRVPGQISVVYAADGHRLGYLSTDVLRHVIPQNSQPQMIRDATVAIEDRRFFQHGGVDYFGMVRAVFRDLFSGGGIQGGSTLTMQLVDNIYPYLQRLRLQKSASLQQSLKYKIIQMNWANELEKQHSKNWVLTQYLNDVPYGTVGGQTAIGIGAASRMFFDKPVQKLDLAQYALLAGLPQAPSDYNPFLYPSLARQRRSEVLHAMVEAKYITQAQANSANASPLQVKPNNSYQKVSQPYVFDYVRQQLQSLLPQSVIDQGGLKVYTTINLQDQAYARTALEAHEGYAGDPAAAVATVDPSNGDILAMAQNTTYGTKQNHTTFDYVTQARRQTGSSFKPFVLMTMIHDYDGDPNKTYYDSKYLQAGWLPGYPTYSVQTAELSYQGPITITKAMTDSDNTVFAQLGVDLGMDKVSATAHAMGITSPLDNNPAEAIGGLRTGVSPMQMADAYATLANGGTHIPPRIISKVVLPSGKVLYFKPKQTHVFSYAETYVADQVLKTVITEGTGTAANYGCPAAGKTGTTSNYTDAWFVGYTPKLSTAVWVGYPNATTSMNDVNGLGPGYGGTLAAPIWHDFMAKASDGYCGDWTPPATPWTGVAYKGAHALSGKVATTTNSTTSGTNTSPTNTKTTSTTTTTPSTQTSTTPTKTTTTPGGSTSPTGGGGLPGHAVRPASGPSHRSSG